LNNVLIITPIKDSIETAQKAVSIVCKYKADFKYLVYNDLSTSKNRAILEKEQVLGFELINIEDYVSTPSLNYRFTLQNAQTRSIDQNAHLLIVESDVFIREDTISLLLKKANSLENCGMVAAVTTDENGNINFPYLHINQTESGVIETKHRVNFCYTLLALPLLKKHDFNLFSEKKDWFDVQISKDSRSNGFKNYILIDSPVIHLPHSSRPWKKLKYENPIKYYFRKFFTGKVSNLTNQGASLTISQPSMCCFLYTTRS
jgi:hypothetical protein